MKENEVIRVEDLDFTNRNLEDPLSGVTFRLQK